MLEVAVHGRFGPAKMRPPVRAAGPSPPSYLPSYGPSIARPRRQTRTLSAGLARLRASLRRKEPNGTPPEQAAAQARTLETAREYAAVAAGWAEGRPQQEFSGPHSPAHYQCRFVSDGLLPGVAQAVNQGSRRKPKDNCFSDGTTAHYLSFLCCRDHRQEQTRPVRLHWC